MEDSQDPYSGQHPGDKYPGEEPAPPWSTAQPESAGHSGWAPAAGPPAPDSGPDAPASPWSTPAGGWASSPPGGSPAPGGMPPDTGAAWRRDWPPPPSDAPNPYAGWGANASGGGWQPAGDSEGGGAWAGYPGYGGDPGYPGAQDNPGAPGGWGHPGDPGAAGGWGGYPGDPGGAGGGGWGPGWSGGPGGPGGQGGWGSPWTPGNSPRPRRTLPSAIVALLLVVAVLVGLGLGHGVWRNNTLVPSSNGSGNNGSNGSGLFGNGNPFGGGSGSGSGSGSSGSQIVGQVQGALVDINTDLGYQQQGGQAAGTGIALSSTGEILTNNHVIAGATQITVTDIGNGRTYPASVVGYDRTHDIAIVQLRGASGLQTASIGDSSRVQVGDAVIGIGNAGGVGGVPSSASGNITALNQSITATDQSDGTSEQLAGLIQVDADIQPGDSGGALVNASGQVIGVDTAASAGFSFQTAGGQGFAIPINQAVSIARQIESGSATASIHLGATAFLGVLVENGNGSGATLNSVVGNGPAYKAGLAGGDVITSLNGQTVDSPTTLTKLIGKYHPGDKVTVDWTDPSGQSHTAVVSLAAGPAA